MNRPGTPALAAALIGFLIFFGNVAAGAAGIGVLLGDVTEMLALFAAVILFVIGVLQRETAAARENNDA